MLKHLTGFSTTLKITLLVSLLFLLVGISGYLLMVNQENIIIKNHVEEACQAQNGTLVVNFCCLENGNGSS